MEICKYFLMVILGNTEMWQNEVASATTCLFRQKIKLLEEFCLEAPATVQECLFF